MSGARGKPPMEPEQLLLRAVANLVRQRILLRLIDEPQSVSHLARSFPIGRSAVFRHVKKLRDAGLLTHRREGALCIYAADPRSLERLQSHVGRLARRAAARAEARCSEALRDAA